jgi:hypothetical protein
MGVRTLQKRFHTIFDTFALPSLPPGEDTKEATMRTRPSSEHQSYQGLDLGFPSSRTMRSKFILFINYQAQTD